MQPMLSFGVHLYLVSVTFVYYVETIEHILKLFSPTGNHIILVFPHHTLWHSDGDPSNG